MVRAAISLIVLVLTAPIGAETVEVRDRGPVDLGTFECRDINRSTIIQRVCYDRAQRRMIVGIKGSYDQYCGLPVQTFDDVTSAPSMGQFFHQSIRGSARDRRYDCRAGRPPGY